MTKGNKRRKSNTTDRRLYNSDLCYSERHEYDEYNTTASKRRYCNQCSYLGTNDCYGLDDISDCRILRNYK
jgi:hypothetical protein